MIICMIIFMIISGRTPSVRANLVLYTSGFLISGGAGHASTTPHHSNVGVFQVYAFNKSHLHGIDCCIQAIRVCLHKFSGRLPCTSIFQAVVR